jgi:hypothetical protein
MPPPWPICFAPTSEASIAAETDARADKSGGAELALDDVRVDLQTAIIEIHYQPVPVIHRVPHSFYQIGPARYAW